MKELGQHDQIEHKLLSNVDKQNRGWIINTNFNYSKIRITLIYIYTWQGLRRGPGDPLPLGRTTVAE